MLPMLGTESFHPNTALITGIVVSTLFPYLAIRDWRNREKGNKRVGEYIYHLIFGYIFWGFFLVLGAFAAGFRPLATVLAIGGVLAWIEWSFKH